MRKTNEIQIRDPFVLAMKEEQIYYLYGTTDKSPWEGKGTGFDVYVSKNLDDWDGPYPAFRPSVDFWADENFWAPEVHYHNGVYFMFASFKTKGKCRGTQILVSDKAIGPFNPHSEGCATPAEWECLDGTLYVDENEEPWMVFCHEWVQVGNGEMCAVRLKKNLEETVGEPVILFRASDAPWSSPNTGYVPSDGKNCYVTDGPFFYKAQNGEILMLWSSYTKTGYAIGTARSSTEKIMGPWIQDLEPIYNKDGGHGMLFRTFDGKLKLSIHAPNDTPNERPVFIDIKDINGKLSLDSNEKY